MADLKVKVKGPMKLYSDNKSAINITHNPVQHDWMKHVEIDRHFIKEKIEEGTMCMCYVPMDNQLADVLTKGLHGPRFHDCIGKLGMEETYSPTWGEVLRNIGIILNYLVIIFGLRTLFMLF